MSQYSRETSNVCITYSIQSFFYLYLSIVILRIFFLKIFNTWVSYFPPPRCPIHFSFLPPGGSPWLPSDNGKRQLRPTTGSTHWLREACTSERRPVWELQGTATLHFWLLHIAAGIQHLLLWYEGIWGGSVLSRQEGGSISRCVDRMGMEGFKRGRQKNCM